MKKKKKYLAWLDNLSHSLMKSKSHLANFGKKCQTQTVVLYKYPPLIFVLLSSFKAFHRTNMVWIFSLYWTRATENDKEIG